MKLSRPRISFGMIVLNGSPFTKHTLRSIYPYAHEIIVAEGAAPAAASISGPDGHSRDGTLQELREFQTDEDPDGKLTVVTAEDEGHDDGFWPGEKDEQSQAYACRATGDYLWQVDVDEYYLDGDLDAVVNMLRDDPTISGMGFQQVSFWGGLGFYADGWYLRRGGNEFDRLFRWGPGYRYVKHRPPTVVDAYGTSVKSLNWVEGSDLRRRGIRLLHYHMLLPKQVDEKLRYYQAAPWATGSDEVLAWAERSWLQLGRPYRVHNVYQYPSWLSPYRGDHPAEILSMMGEQSAKGDVRGTSDIDRLVRSRRYRLGIEALKAAEPIDRVLRRLAARVRRRSR